jgi:signal transduction histidine kinase
MNWSVGTGATVGLALAVIVLLASTGLSYRNIRRVADNEARVTHTHEVIGALADVLLTLANAETGQRGYLITGEPPYLERYHAAQGSVQDRVDRLKELTSDNPDQQRHLAALEDKTAARLKFLEDGIAARDAREREGGDRVLVLGRGKAVMDAIRGLVAEMEQTEKQLLEAREAESRTSYQTAVVTLFVTALLGLGLVGTGYGFAVREVATRQHGVEALQQANEALEVRVQERTADFAAANESLRQSNRELEQFASVASHDLQEPLRKIQAFGDRLQEKCADGLGEQGRDYVARMQESAARMRNLIDALLTYSRVTTKAQPFVPVDLGATAREVVSDLEGRIQHSGGRVEVGALPTVEADPMQMRQLLQNLVGNGLKFRKPGEPSIVRVESQLLKDAGGNGRPVPRYEIAVRDNGIGFDEVYLDRIFDVFQRLHGRQEYEGTGMGLAICRRIVERHGGSITAKSAPDRGTTFLITLPVKQPREEKS